MNRLPESVSEWPQRRSSASRPCVLWTAAAIIALALSACGGPSPKGSGPPVGNGPPNGNGDSLETIPPGVVATVDGINASVNNPFGSFAVSLYPWYPGPYDTALDEEHRLATGTVGSAGQLSMALPAFDEAQLEAATKLPFLLCEEEHWLPTGVSVVSHGRHPHPTGSYLSAYMRLASLSGPSGTVVVQVWYVYSDQTLDRTCKPDAFSGDVDVRLRPGWNVLTVYVATAAGIFYRTGEPPVALPWVGPVPAYEQ